MNEAELAQQAERARVDAILSPMARAHAALSDLEQAVSELSAFDSGPQARAQVALDNLCEAYPELGTLTRHYFYEQLRGVDAKIKAFAANNPQTHFALDLSKIN